MIDNAKNSRKANFLTAEIPDLYITALFFIPGALIIPYLFYQDTQLNNRTLIQSFLVLYQYFPVVFAAFYLWFKAVVIDFIRIKNNEKIQMPGYVFIIHGLLLFMIYASNNLIYNNIREYLGPVSTIRVFLLYKYPVIFWIIVDVFASLLLHPLQKLFGGNVAVERKTEKGMINLVVRSYITYIISTSLSLFF